MITADTITDEQIRELREEYGSENAFDTESDEIAFVALGLDPDADASEVSAARARCAEILNVRAVKGDKDT